MASGTLASVVIPVRNRENTIERALVSVGEQTYRPIEIIVVDNGSSDGSVRKIQNWWHNFKSQHPKSDGISFQLLQENQEGAAQARERGLETAGGEFIIFFDSDDEMHPELLEEAMMEFRRYPSSDIVCWKSRIHLLDGHTRIPKMIWKDPLEGHLIHTLLRPQGTLLRKSLVETAGGWRKDLKVWDDLEWGFRLLQQDPEIRFIDKILTEIYAQKDSLTGENFTHKRGEWEKALKEISEDIKREPSRKENRRAERMLDYKRVVLAAFYAREGDRKGGKKILEKVTSDKPFHEKMALTASYHFTRSGLRGARTIFYGASLIFRQRNLKHRN